MGGAALARIRPLREDEVPGDIAKILAATAGWLGEPSIGAGIQAYSPAVLDASRRLNAMPARSGLLDPQLRDLVCLRAAEMVGCPF